MAASLSTIGLSPAQAGTILPTGGTVAAGTATIGAPTSSVLTISQSSPKAIIDWSGFSIGQGATVRFDNGSGATLNRVTGAAPSSIDGLLSGSGSVYLINPNGVIVGKTGVVNVGGTFVASTLDVSDAAFLGGGDLTFTGSGAAGVINLGKVGSLGGDVAMIGAVVENDGVVSAPNGTAGLISGHSVLMRDAALDDGKFSVLVGGSGTSATNGGTVAAANAELRAEGGNVYALAANTAGVIRATGVKAGDGRVWLMAAGGELDVAGVIEAQGANGSAGAVETSGGVVKVGKASIDARGGTWTLDPDDLTIDSAAAQTISASLTGGTSVVETTSAPTSGGSGDISLAAGADIQWSSAATLTLSAYRNLALAGTIEVQGAGTLNLTADNATTGVGALTVNAPVTVSGGGAVNISAALDTLDVAHNTAQMSFGAGGSIQFTGTSAGQPTGALKIFGIGYILVADLATLSTRAKADFNHHYDFFALAKPIDASGTTYGPNVVGQYFQSTLEGLGNTISNLTLNGGDTYVGFTGRLYGGAIDNVGFINETVTPTNGTYIGGLVGYSNGLIRNSYVTGIVNNANSTTNQGTGGVVGYSANTVVGSHSTATVSSVSNAVGGLAGYSSQPILNSYATGSVSSTSYAVGGLVGSNYSTISGSYATGAVSGTNSIGGLVGVNGGAGGRITTSYASGAVTASSYNAGGLVGDNEAAVDHSYATGSVLATTIAGGLAGYSNGPISDSFAMGPSKTTSYESGGLVGVNGSTITGSYATGAVSGSSNIGGLVGYNPSGTITSSYWDTATTGLSSSVGGGVGQSTATLQNGTLPTGFDSGWAAGTGLYPYLVAFYPTAPQAISGLAKTLAGTAMLGAQVQPYEAGAPLGSPIPVSGANGYFYGLLPSGTPSSGAQAVGLSVSGGSFGSGLSYYGAATPVAGVLGGLSVSAAALQATTVDTSYAAFLTHIPTAFGAGAYATLSAGLSSPALLVTASGAFTIDQAVSGYSAVNLTTGGALTFAADLTITGALTLNAAADVTQTSGAVTAASLTGASTGSTTLSGAVGVLGAYMGGTGLSLTDSTSLTVSGTASSGTGNLSLATTGASNITLAGALTAGAANSGQTVTLTSAGAITQSSGVITAGTLTGSSGGLVTLTGSNVVGALAAFTGGTGLSFTDAQALTVSGPINAGTGALALITTGAGHNLTLSGGLTAGAAAGAQSITLTSAGTLSQTGGVITAGTLTGSSSGTATLTGANMVGGLGAFSSSSGGFSFTDATDLTVTGLVRYNSASNGSVALTTTSGGLTLAAGVTSSTSGSNSVTLTSAGAISQSGGVITTGTLAGSSLGATVLNGANVVTKLGAFTSGAGLALTDAASLTVSGPLDGGTGDVALTTTGTNHTLTLSGAVTAGAATGAQAVSLVSASTTAQTSGVITAGSLSSSSAGTATLTQANLVGSLASFTNSKSASNLSFKNGRDLTVSGPVQNTFGTVTLTTASGGNLTLAANVVAGTTSTQTLTLTSAGSITQTAGAITTGTLTGSSVGQTLLGGANAFGKLGSFGVSIGTSGASGFAAADSLALTVTGTVSTPNGQEIAIKAPGLSIGLGTALNAGATGVVALAPYASGDGLIVSTAGTATPGALVVSTASVGRVTAATLLLGRDDTAATPSAIAGSITLGAAGDVLDLSRFATLNLQTTGAVTQGAGARFTAGTLAGGAGSLTLLGANSLTKLGAFTSSGGFSLNDTAALTIAGPVTDATAVTVRSGAMTLIGGVTAPSILLAANGSFTNSAGSLTPAAGGFTIYTQNSANVTGALPANSFGGLTGANYYNDAYNFTTGAFASAVPTGNHFVYGYAASLTPTLTGGVSKTYDGSATLSTANLTVGATLLSPNDSAAFSIGAASYDTADAGTGKTVTATGVALTSNPNNYTLAGATASGAVGTIAPLAITLTGGQTYDGSTNAPAANLTVTNAVGGDAVGLTGVGGLASKNAGSEALTSTAGALNGLSVTNANYTVFGGSGSVAVGVAPITLTAASNSKSYDGTTAAAAAPTLTSGTLYDMTTLSESYASKNAGTGLTLTPTATIADGNGGLNYAVTLIASANGVIDPAAVTITAAANSKTYDGTTSALAMGALSSGTLFGSDTASYSESYASKNAGTGLTLTPTGAISDGNGGQNYAVTLVASANGVIDPEAITLTAAANSKTYDGTTSASAAPTLTSGTLFGSDTATLSERYASRNAGAGLILTPSATIEDGNGGRNYAVTLVSAANGVIDPEALTFTAAANSKIYDGTTSAAAAPTLTSGVLYDVATLLERYASNNVGGGLTLTPTAAIADENGGANYAVTLLSNANGVIDPAALAVSLRGAVRKTYDGTTVATLTTDNYGLSGVVAGDAGTVALNDPASGTYASKNAGTGLVVTVNGLALSGAGAGNYTVASSVSGAVGRIDPKALSAAVTANDKTYDGTTADTGSATLGSGAILGDKVSLTGGTYTFADKNAGAGKSVRVDGLALTGADAGNYVLSVPATTLASIGRKAVSLLLTGPVEKTYDGTTAAILTAANANLAGLIASDSVVVGSGSATYDTAHVGAGKTVTVTGGALSGADAGNYSLVAATVSAPVGIIDARPITIAAGDEAKLVGQADPALLYAIAAGSLAAGDGISGALVRAAGEAPGDYGIGLGSLRLTPDYAISFRPGVFSIQPVATEGSIGGIVSDTGGFTDPNGIAPGVIPQRAFPTVQLLLGGPGSTPSPKCEDPNAACANVPYPTNGQVAPGIRFVSGF